VDVHREGWEKCTKAMDSAVQLPEGRALFGEALDRFRDVTCIGFYNWGNVHMCLAKKLVVRVREVAGLRCEGRP